MPKSNKNRSIKIEKEIYHPMQNKDNRITVAGDNNIIIQDAEHGLRSVPKYLTVPPAEPPTTFVGREEALEQLHQSLQSQQRLLLASGIRGIGKTTLAQAYFHKHQSDYQCMAWVNCPNGILQGLLECTIDDSLGFEAQRDNWERHYQLVWKKLANLQGKHLLVLDNANDGNEVLRYLQPIPNWTILVTTTADLQGRLPQEKVERLREGPAIQLFCSYYPAAKGQDELLRRFLNAIGYHTLTIELLAKNLAELRNYSLQEFCDDLENRGVLQLPKTRTIDAERYHNKIEVNPKDLIRELFDISTLPSNYWRLLLELAMLPAEPLPYEHLRVLLNITEEMEAEFDTILKKLSTTGWLEHDRAADTYYLHTLIAEVVRDKHRPTYARFAQLADTLKNLLKDEHIKLGEKIPYLPYAQSLAQRLPDAELAGLCFSACDRYSELGNLQLGMWFAEEAQKRFFEQGDDYNAAAFYQRLGDIHKNWGKFDQAFEYYQQYNNHINKLLEKEPNSDKLKNILAISYSKLGDLWQNKGDFNRALEFFEKSNQLCEELYRDNPHAEDLGYGLCISYERLGDLWQEKGDFEQALEFFEKLNALIQKLHLANPQHQQIKNELAISYSKLGDLWQNKGDFNRALDFFEKQTLLFEELYRDNPLNENLKNGLAISYSKLGDLWQKKGDFNRALEFFEKFNQLCEELYQANPQNENLKNGLAISYSKLGDLWQDKGDFNRALDFFEKYNQLREELYRDNPHNYNLKNGLGISYYKLAEIKATMQQSGEALSFYQQAEALWQALWEQTGLPVFENYLEIVRARIAALSTGVL
ncbi:MAG: NB-ARC domain-containing protein [Saprospiraceae bacterium]|nr:NB-ARC domain-containing protein [Saprospiraceae bacterium]